MLWRTEVGTATLYGIQDGHSDRDPLEYLLGSTPAALAEHRALLNDDGTMPNSFSCYIFDTGAAIVMIDTGFGHNVPEGRSGGNMPAGLDALGIHPGDVDHVVFTHLHPDHILGSLDRSGAPFFTNATHWTLRREFDHWRHGTDDRSTGIARVATALDDAGALNAVEEPGQVVPGVTTIATYGHSPGHTAVRVSSGDESVLIVGDVTFTPIQLDHPDWNVPFDGDPDLAAKTRTELFDELARSGARFAAGHYGWPGFGRVVETADGRRYQRLDVEDLTG